MSNKLASRSIRLFLAANLLGCAAFAQTTTLTYSYNGLPLPIYSDDADVITIANIHVSQPVAISKVTVRVKIDYPKTSDLKLYLYSPVGTRAILLEHDCDIANVDTTFDDSAPSLWKEFCPVEAGRGPFRPDQPLSNFNSDDSAFGTWRLAVENDESDSRSGWITDFALTITGTTQLSPGTRSDLVFNAASVRDAGSVAPGELVSILGVALGPLPGVAAGSGAFPTSLGGSSVLFNGVAAPISYASAYRLDAQAPFTLTPGTTVNVQVKTGAGTSSQATLNVVAAVPGLYTNGALGSGGVVAVNQDGSTNSILNPAARGSYITVYASGLGVVDPALAAGAVPPSSPLSRVTGTVTAYVAGDRATVQYAGVAPGYPGLYQLNIAVPSGASVGAQDLLIFVNGKSSQAGVTIQVR